MDIEVNDLTFSYDQKPLLDIESFQLKSAERLFISGGSGCGKSTFLNLISGLIPFENGDIRIFGQSNKHLSNSKKDQLRADNLSYIFQQFNLLPYLSATQNILLSLKLSKTRKIACLKEFGHLDKAVEYWLQKLNLPAQTHHIPVRQLSVGQQQRVASARAFIGEPKIIIADEPTSALDKKNQDNFLSLVNELCSASKCSLIFVSHDQSLVSEFDRHINFEQLNRHAHVLD